MKKLIRNHRACPSQELPHTLNEELIDPGRLGCPDCASNENSNGILLHHPKLIQRLRQFNADGRIIIFDPLQEMTLSGPAIRAIGANGPCVQFSLHEGWAEEYLGEFSNEFCHTPTAIRPKFAREERCPGHEPELAALVSELRAVNDRGLLVLWDPVSEQLLSDHDIFGIAANGSDIQISLSDYWFRDPEDEDDNDK